MIHDMPILDLEIMLQDAFNYERIRLEAVKIFLSYKPTITGISEKGRIFYNGFRIYMVDTSKEKGAESLFDIEVLDEETEYHLLEFYKKCFVRAFDYLLRDGRLIPAKQLLQREW